MREAKLVRFYGMPLREVRALTNEDNHMLWLSIDQIEAQETLIALQVSGYPHSKKDYADKLFARVRDMAYPKDEDTKEYDTHDLANLIRGKLGR